MADKLFTTNAVRLRIVLIALLCLLIAGAVGISALGLGYLNKKAADVQQVVFDATSSDQKLQQIQDLATALDRNQEAVSRAKQVVAESKSYQYQDVIIRDLQAMATRAGISITNFDFSTGVGGPANSSAATTPAPAAASAGSGLRSTTVNVTLSTPVNYRNFLTFIHYIEQNLTKMQISKVGLAHDDGDTNKDSVTSETLTIEVYIR